MDVLRRDCRCRRRAAKIPIWGSPLPPIRDGRHRFGAVEIAVRGQQRHCHARVAGTNRLAGIGVEEDRRTPNAPRILDDPLVPEVDERVGIDSTGPYPAKNSASSRGVTVRAMREPTHEEQVALRAGEQRRVPIDQPDAAVGFD